MASPALNGSLSIERRRFLRQITAAGLVAGTSTLPAMAQETTGRAFATVGSGQASVGETLARYATDLKYEDLPEDVIRIAKRTILDTFGCAFGGYSGRTEQDRDQARERRQCKAGRDRPVQRHQDEPRSGGFRQRRDDPISRFQRRLRQSHPWRRPPERHDRGVADLGRAERAQRPRSHHRDGARLRGVLQDRGCL